MAKKKISIDPADFDKNVEYSGDELVVYSVKHGNEKLESSKSLEDMVLILPYDLSATGPVSAQIKRLYLNRFYNYVEEELQFKPIVSPIDEDQDDSLLDSVKRISLEQLGITSKDFSIDNVRYLGKVILNEGHNAVIHCYGIDVTGLADSPMGFSPKLHDEPVDKTVEPVLYRDVIQGEYSDSLTLSSALLLLASMD